MPRSCSARYKELLGGAVLFRALLARLERADGLVLGFTSADEPILFGGLAYRPSDGLSTSALESTAGTGVDNLDVTGWVSDDRITEEDLEAGLWGGARLTISSVFRDELDAGAMVLHDGRLGEVTLDDGRFKAAARGLSARMKTRVGDQTSKGCVCRRLGDGRCRVDLAGTAASVGVQRLIRQNATVVSAAGWGLVATGFTASTGFFSAGIVKALTGPNAGQEREIKTHGPGGALTLRRPFPFSLAAGDAVRLEAGCDRTIRTCHTKFGNQLNFQGQPFLPTNDKVMKVGR